MEKDRSKYSKKLSWKNYLKMKLEKVGKITATKISWLYRSMLINSLKTIRNHSPSVNKSDKFWVWKLLSLKTSWIFKSSYDPTIRKNIIQYEYILPSKHRKINWLSRNNKLFNLKKMKKKITQKHYGKFTKYKLSIIEKNSPNWKKNPRFTT